MPSSSNRRIPRISLLFLVFSLCLCIQFVSFVWLNSKVWHGRPENIIQGFRNDTFNTDQGIVVRSERKTNITNLKPTKVTYSHEMTKQGKTAGTSTKIRALTTNNVSNRTTVDMENDFYPLVNFSFVWPETTPELQNKRDFFLVVLVNSAAKGEKYRTRRNAIRRTWANITQCEQRIMLEDPKLKPHRWILVFSLGITDDPAENEANQQESRTYNDVLIGNFRDHYLHNVIKVFMGELWVSTLNVRYILKTDDDVYVRIPSVIQWLAEQNYPKSFYGGAPYFNFKVDRNPDGKWAVSKRYFNEDIFPAFCAGAFYVLSTDLLSKFFNYVRQRRPFHTDDAYIGIAARDLNISVKRIPGLMLEDNMPKYLWNFNDCKLLQARGFGHSIEPLLMSRVFNRLDKMCEEKRKC